MKNSLKYLALASGAIAILIGATVLAQGQDADNGGDHGPRVHEHHAKVCLHATEDDVQCHAHVVVDEKGAPKSGGTPTGYGPAQFRAAYGLPASSNVWAWNGQTIAIVDAFDDPKAESDLNFYSSYYGLPPCTTANGCFKKVNQNGGTRYPRGNSGWGLEISLDVQIAHAICPNCKILLVEASSNSYTNLLMAEDYATAHANVVSNSWGSGEFSGETSAAYDGHFNRPGVPITVSSGDSGYGVEYPAASRYVTAVGGTTLVPSATLRGWSETAWSGSGSGCSAYETKPGWQSDLSCSRRTVADVSADADPYTGAAVYDSYGYSGWLQVGGTSLSSPLIAGVYALAGNGSATAYGSYPYSHTGSLFDVSSGNNGSCGGSYLCTALSGYDGPTGLGTPNGIGAF